MWVAARLRSLPYFRPAQATDLAASGRNTSSPAGLRNWREWPNSSLRVAFHRRRRHCFAGARAAVRLRSAGFYHQRCCPEYKTASRLLATVCAVRLCDERVCVVLHRPANLRRLASRATTRRFRLRASSAFRLKRAVWARILHPFAQPRRRQYRRPVARLCRYSINVVIARKSHPAPASRRAARSGWRLT